MGVFGVLVGGQLRTAWLEDGKLTGATFAKVVNANFGHWLEEVPALYLDGEKAYYTADATEACRAAASGTTVEKIPPNSPDLNPVENAWALLQERVVATDPGKLEDLPAFKNRVRNALRYVNLSK